MTAPDLAAALLKDVPKYTAHHVVSTISHPGPVWLHETDVIAALSRALDPAIAEQAGEVLEGVSDAPWRVGNLESYEMSGLAFRRVYFPTASEGEIREAHIRGEDCDENARFIAWCREGVPALLVQNAALRAEIDTMIDADTVQKMLDSAQPIMAEACAGYEEENRDLQTRLTAAEAKVEKLRTERDEWRKLESAAQGLSEVLDQHETKGPLPDTVLMFCWLAAQNVRAVLRGYMLENPE